ncbi:hypothetical protein PS15m_005195 [Mucor circinelloides]
MNDPYSDDFLWLPLSLQRPIIMNLEKLQTIYETVMKDSINFLTSRASTIANNLFFREDTPYLSQESSSSTSTANSII